MMGLFSVVCIFCNPLQKDSRVLNYAPGPMSTEMFEDITNNSDSDELRKIFFEMTQQVCIIFPSL